MSINLSRRAALAGVAAASIIRPAQAQVQGVTAGEIVLGTHLDLSGPVAAGAPYLRSGTLMRLEEANEKGGVHGRKIRLVVEDNASQPQVAVRAVTKLVQQDQVFAIVNPFGSGTNAATVKRAVDAGVIVYSPWGASAVFRQASGNSPLLLTTTPHYDGAMATGLAWMLNEMKPQKVGYIYQEGPFGDQIGAGVKKALAAKSATLAAEASYKAGDIDFSAQVARMKAAGCDLVVTATITRETVGVMAEVRKIGWSDVKVLTAIPGRTMNVARLGGAAIEGLYGVGGWNIYAPNDTTPAVRSFFDALKSKYNLEPDENAMLAYAYMDIFVRALEAAGKDLTPQKMAEALHAVRTTHPVFYGETGFAKGHISPETIKIDQVKNGVWSPVSGALA